jgi:RNAse (barnase) inhibitor barstar
MSEQDSIFRFEDFAKADMAAFVAELPVGIRSRAVLFDELDRKLKFPDYFGGNWDALWECICDLSWLPCGTVVVKHSDLPLAEDFAEAKIYLSILERAVRKLAGSKDHELIVMFPRKSRDRIAWLLRSVAYERSRLQ